MPIPVFNEESHTYTTPNSQKLDGVTSIIGEYQKVKWGGAEFYVDSNGRTIDAETMRKAAEYGSAVHKLLELSLLHGVGSFSYPAQLENAVRQIEAFITDYRPEVIMCEQPMYSEKRLVAGTPDLFFRSHRIRSGKRTCCLDAKTGVGIMTGPQTAIYTEMFREHTGEKGLIDRFKLQLPKDSAAYKMEPLTNKHDLKFFEYKLFSSRFVAAL